MFRSAIPFIASLVLATAVAPSQSGRISSTDPDHQCLVVQVDRDEFKVDATKVSFLDSAGNPAKFEDFAVDEKVIVTIKEGQITTIMKAASSLDLAMQDQPAGTVVSTNAELGQIVVRVGSTEYTATASAIKLLDLDGNPAKLADFAAGDKVKVTLTEDGVSEIQKAK